MGSFPLPEVWGYWGARTVIAAQGRGEAPVTPTGPRDVALQGSSVMGAQDGMRWPQSWRRTGPRRLIGAESASPGRRVGLVAPRPGQSPRKGHSSQYQVLGGTSQVRTPNPR